MFSILLAKKQMRDEVYYFIMTLFYHEGGNLDQLIYLVWPNRHQIIFTR